MTKEVATYLSVRVTASPGRRPGSLSRRKRPVMEGAERLRIAREVHQALGEPEIYEKLEHGALKAAGGKVAERHRTIPDKIVDTCYREFKNNLQTEMAFVDWDRWIKGYRVHGFAQVRSGKSAISRVEALQFWREKLLNHINMLTRL